MYSIPNRLNTCDGDTTNHRKFFPIQVNHSSKIVQSMFITSNHTNHGDLFSSSFSFTNSQNSRISSSSFGFHNSHVTNHMMRGNIESSSFPDYFSIQNPHFTRVSFTQTIANIYTSTVPTNTLDTVQSDIERVKRAMDSKANRWNSTIYRPNCFKKKYEIWTPKPFNVIFPPKHFECRQHLNRFSFSQGHVHDQQVFQNGRSLKIISKPTNIFEKATPSIGFEENKKDDDDEYDGRTHSLPYEKYGPYTCPKCNVVYETSQKFAAHILCHYKKSETIKERGERFCARNKRKYRKLMVNIKRSNQMMGQ